MTIEPLIRLGTTWRRAVNRQPGWAMASLAVLGLLEIYGRRVTSDIGDVAGVLALALLAAATAARHDVAPVPWWGWLVRQGDGVLRGIKRLHVDVGVDLRESPPYERGWPRPTIVSLVGLAAGVLSLCGVARWMPGGLRWIGVRTSYTAYLAVLAVLWAAHGIGVLFFGYLFIGHLRDWFTRRRALADEGPRRHEGRAVVAAALLLGAAVIWAPPIWAVSVLLTLVSAHFVTSMLPGRPRLLLMWKPDERDAEPRTVAWDWYVASEPARVALALLALVLMTAGADLLAVRPAVEGMPVSQFLGRLLAWVGTAGIGSISIFLLHLTYLARRADPSRAQASGLVLHGDPGESGPAIETHLTTAGFRIRRAGTEPRRGDLQVTIAPEDETLCWPPEGGRFKVSELLSAEAPGRLRRRHQIVQRRLLFRGLSRIFKRAARHSFAKGSGFWVAPHHWFSLGLTRDVDEEDGALEGGTVEQVVGPRFHQVIPLSARHHFHQVMRGAEVDLIFVEDGVDFRRFRRVLGVLFEVFDMHAGQRGARDLDFTGLPGVRVLLFDFGPGRNFEVEGYPEPDYEGLGRGRVLHVFRDRGAQEEEVTADPPRERKPIFI